MQPISLIASDFVPTSSFTGGEVPTVLRGSNAVIRAASGRSKVENYPGSLNLSENYDISTETINGTISYTSGSREVVGVGTSFESELRPGQKIMSSAGEPLSVNTITDDTHFTADRPATTTGAALAAYYLLTLFECDKKRGVLRRGNAISHERKDLYYVGDGLLRLNGTSTGFTATQRPKRLQRAAGGTYTDTAIGFDAVPVAPVITPSAGGWKGMQAGNYSFMFSWWNSVTDGYSNPCNVVKKDGAAADIVITAGQRFELDFTVPLASKPANADGFVVWGSQSGGGVTAVNTSNFQQGAWLECAKIRTTAYTIVDADVDLVNDKITVPGHKFKTAQSIYFNTTWGPFTAATEYFAIYDGTNTIKVATTAANANAGTAINIAADPGVGSHTVGAISSTDKCFIEYLDAEMGRTASGNNFPPPECEWLTEFANTVHYVSSLGKKTVTRTDGASPGNYVVPMKDTNKEAAPPEWRVSVGSEITGFANGVGRLFCLTANEVQFVTPTGRTELARLNPTLLDMPFSSRPFWTKGGISPYNIVVVQGDVFLYTGRTLLRSPSNADTNNVPFEIGLPVADLTAEWYDGHALLGHDPKNQQVCLISSATKKNGDGYWISEILPYSLQKNQWQPVITVSSSTRDMIISGVATVNGRMEFLAGGRVSGGAKTLSTFRYDELSGDEIPWYIAFQPSDSGEERRPKQIKFLRITARGNEPKIQIHGTTPASRELSIDDIEAGTNSVSGDITLTTSAELAREFEVQYHIKNLGLWCLRYADTYAGSGEVNRLDEVVVGIEAHGIAQ